MSDDCRAAKYSTSPSHVQSRAVTGHAFSSKKLHEKYVQHPHRVASFSENRKETLCKVIGLIGLAWNPYFRICAGCVRRGLRDAATGPHPCLAFGRGRFAASLLRYPGACRLRVSVPGHKPPGFPAVLPERVGAASSFVKSRFVNLGKSLWPLRGYNVPFLTRPV